MSGRVRHTNQQRRRNGAGERSHLRIDRTDSTRPLVTLPKKTRRALPLVPLHGVRPDGTRAIVGHFSLWGSGRAPADGATTMVVHFATEKWEETIDDLARGFKASRRAAVVAVVLLPAGVEPGRSPAAVDTHAALVVGEDVDGAWARLLGVSKTPATPWSSIAGDTSCSKRKRPCRGRVSAIRSRATPSREGGCRGSPCRLASFPVTWRRSSRSVLAEGPSCRCDGCAGAAWCSRSGPRGASRVSNSSVNSAGRTSPRADAARWCWRSGMVSRLIRWPGWRERNGSRSSWFRILPAQYSRRFVVGVWPSTVWIGPNMRVEGVSLGLTPIAGDDSGSHYVHAGCGTPPG